MGRTLSAGSRADGIRRHMVDNAELFCATTAPSGTELHIRPATPRPNMGCHKGVVRNIVYLSTLSAPTVTVKVQHGTIQEMSIAHKEPL